MLKGKQKNLDKNNNGRIDAEDFKLLKADKPMKASTGKSVRGYGAARTSGTGLMDEQMAPGKVIKASMGEATDYKKYLKGLKKATDSVKKDKENKFLKRRMKLMGMPKLSKGGGADTGIVGELRSTKIQDKFPFKNLGQDKDRLTRRDVEMAKTVLKGPRTKALKAAQNVIATLKKMDTKKKMGGGMMNKPMGYKSGTMVMARGCKLGRKKATKIT